MTRTLALLSPLLIACASPGDPVEGSSDTNLATLSLSQGELFPTPSPGQAHYAVEGAELIAAGTTLTATPMDADAKVHITHATIDGVVLQEGLGPDLELSLGTGERITIAVTSADGSATATTLLTTLPEDFPQLDVERTGETSDGYYFLANFDFQDQPEDIGRYLMIVDDAGVPVWFRRHDEPSFDLRVGAGGELSFVGTPDGEQDRLGLVLEPSDYDLSLGYEPLPVHDTLGVFTDPHELQVLPGGGVLGLAMAGRYDDLSAWGGPDEALVLDNVIQEFDAAGELVFEWSTRDQVDFDDLPHTVIDAMGDEWEYAHLNAIEVDPEDDNLVISMRLPSQVEKVARHATTYRGERFEPGEILWTLGGVASDFTFIDDTRKGGWQGFAGQHSSRVLPGDRILLFDNGTNFVSASTGDARVVEYALDHEAMTATRVFSHELTDAGPTMAAGSVQRLDDGHTVIGWGSLQEWQGQKAPSAMELDADGEVVWSLVLPDNQWTYRVWKFEGDPVTGEWLP